MTAITFRVHSLLDGTHLAWAVVCAAARYASMLTPGSEHLKRIHPPAPLWREVEHEIAVGLNPGPLPADGAIAALLADTETKTRVVQYVTMKEISNDNPFAVATTLDAWLRGQERPA